jgi:hypothetical protein
MLIASRYRAASTNPDQVVTCLLSNIALSSFTSRVLALLTSVNDSTISSLLARKVQ